uniref:Uncharacterized protein n=1 Tax=Solanum lycopersicum TaxID=4081 RepID=K4B2J5_SOLLC
MARFMHLQHPVLQRCAIQSQPTLFLTEMAERVKHDDGRTVENLVHMFLDEGLASEIGSIEDKDSVGALGTLEFKGWVVESLPNSLKHLNLDIRMSIEQLSYCCENSRRSVLVPHVVSSGVKANDLGAYFMRFLTTLWNILYVSIFRSLSCDDEEALNKLQDMDSQL